MKHTWEAGPSLKKADLLWAAYELAVAEQPIPLAACFAGYVVERCRQRGISGFESYIVQEMRVISDPNTPPSVQAAYAEHATFVGPYESTYGAAARAYYKQVKKHWRFSKGKNAANYTKCFRDHREYFVARLASSIGLVGSIPWEALHDRLQDLGQTQHAELLLFLFC